MMSTRSKREHKPTSKFLKYYNDEICSSKILRKSLPKNDTPSPTSNKKRKIEMEEIKSKKTMPEKPSKRMKYAASTFSEVRRSGRQAKPNEKLKKFSQVSLNSSKESDLALSDDQVVKHLKPNFIEANHLKITNIKGKVGKSKNIASISPMIKTENITTPIKINKQLTIGLSDCVISCEDINVNQFAVKREEAKTAMDRKKEVNKNNLNGNDKSDLSSSAKFYGKMRVIVRKSNLKAGVIGRIGPITGKVTHKNDSDKKVVDKFSSVSTELDTCDSSPTTVFDKKNSIRCSRNKLAENKVNAVVGKSDNIKKIMSPYTKKALVKPIVKAAASNLRSKSTSNKILDNTCLNNTATTRVNKTDVVSSPQKDIKDTLQKFLLMGHKVANAISETLKTNEEELLSKSSTFEKKCINLVQSVANTSSDISEEDMKTILKCLDEEQEERRSYRQTFLESLRVAHLTNMALYSQMISVLHTL